MFYVVCGLGGGTSSSSIMYKVNTVKARMFSETELLELGSSFGRYTTLWHRYYMRKMTKKINTPRDWVGGRIHFEAIFRDIFLIAYVCIKYTYIYVVFYVSFFFCFF